LSAAHMPRARAMGPLSVCAHEGPLRRREGILGRAQRSAASQNRVEATS